MKSMMIPAEVIAHFDTEGKVTPYRVRYEKDGISIMRVSRLLKRGVSMFSGNTVEIYECAAICEDSEVLFVLNFEKKLNKWFLTKL